MPEAETPKPTPPEAAPTQPAPVAAEVKVTVEPPTDWRRVHLWHIQPVRDALVVLLVLGIFQLGYVLRGVTVPLLLAVLLAYLFEPLVDRMTRGDRMRRPFAAGVIIAAMVIGVGGPVLLGVGFAAVQTVSYTQTLATNLGKLQASLAAPNDAALADAVPERWRPFRDFAVGIETAPRLPPPEPEEAGAAAPESPAAPKATAPAEPGTPGTSGKAAGAATKGGEVPKADPALAQAEQKVDIEAEQRPIERLIARSSSYLREFFEAAAKFIGKGALGAGATAVQAALRFVAGAAVLVFSLFLTLFFFFFISSSWPRVKGSAMQLIPQWSRGRTLDILAKMDRVIAAFIRGRLIIMAIMCVSFIITYWLIGVPAAIVVGLVGGVLAIVPYLAMITLPACWLLMWLQPVGPEWQQTWWWILFAPPVAYYLIQTTDDYFWTPRIQGKATDMDTPTILFTVLAGATLAGFYGVLVAIPVGACLKIIIREAWHPRVKAWAEGRVRDILPLSRYSPLEAKGESKNV
ncbi:MAG: AI-2E family transporter [Phycisphaerales bacterium]|nr:AI-2E family transporter [Phycisphaerales bacterium]